MNLMRGVESVGEVTAVGLRVSGIRVGDVVACAASSTGAYAEEQIIAATKVVPLPPSIHPVVAASVMLKGMTARYLLRKCFRLGRDRSVLVHAAAGGTGSLLCQWGDSIQDSY
ncbi:hypothetical protein SASPL_157634 [Salvia splendens]|uniref:Alcohol dehydrogenase-like N-terminal domain-containing protein n=1 Tax=Salvia splendens TaxID=180675 RepID=A0A8X8VUK8_SALSN|nr:hypothetical protein SASPL_157634 [Salvia splendens]